MILLFDTINSLTAKNCLISIFEIQYKPMNMPNKDLI